MYVSSFCLFIFALQYLNQGEDSIIRWHDDDGHDDIRGVYQKYAER